MLPLRTTAADAAAVLTATGLEVEGIDRIEAIPGGLAGLVVGEIEACSPHPNADRLQICMVNVGEAEALQIVCGAKNARKGLRVVVALVGAELHPISGEPFTIKKGKIRGETSMGMICAEDEIGVGHSHEGIIELPDHFSPGTPVSVVYELESDEVLEIGLTPNRTDGMSHWGVARDLRAGLVHETVDGIAEDATALTMPRLADLPNNGLPEWKIDVTGAPGCAKYLGLLMRNVQVKPSPDHVQRRLRSIGVQPINNIVDATNFVLHEMGQPLHAFDADAIDGKSVIVRNAFEGETFVTLDGEERTLHPEDQVIANANGAMCLAGVFGGKHSGVSEKTQNIFIESAYFDPVVTRKMAKRHGLSTDASFRFERGVDPHWLEPALRRVAYLIAEWAGGEGIGLAVGTQGNLPAEAKVVLEWNDLDRMIGETMDRAKVKAIFADLDIRITKENAASIELMVPAYRRDVTRPADIIEEVLRIYGFDKISIPSRMISTAAHQASVPEERTRLQIANVLVNRGFQEIMSNSMTRAAHTDSLGETGQDGWELSRRIELMNPLSGDLGVMRQSLVFQGLEAISHNKNHQNPDLRLFEIGRVYQHRKNAESETKDAARRYEEDERLSIICTGQSLPENWNNPKSLFDPFGLKGDVLAMLHALGVNEVKESPFHSGLMSEGLEISCQGKVIGRIGRIRAGVAKKLGVGQPVFWGDFSVRALSKISNKSHIKTAEVAKFPSVRRDLSLILEKHVTFDTVRNAAFQGEKRLLKRVGLFDVYEGDKLQSNEMSYAISLILQDESKTLNDKQIEHSVQRILDSIIDTTGARLRDS